MVSASIQWPGCMLKVIKRLHLVWNFSERLKDCNHDLIVGGWITLKNQTFIWGTTVQVDLRGDTLLLVKFSYIQVKPLSADKEIAHIELSLTFSQTTNFRLFQTERVCRRQFQVWWKWQKVLQMVRKRCGKRRNCSSRAISPFPTVFSKDLYCRHVKTRACLGKR